MGLVRTTYPEARGDYTPARFFGECSPDRLADWKDFLKIALDFHARGGSFINLPNAWRKWGGTKLSARQFLPPESKKRLKRTSTSVGHSARLPSSRADL